MVFSQTIGPIELKFHVKTSYDKLAKIYANILVTCILLAHNQKADDLGTWYVALGMWGLPSLFK